MCTSFVYRKDSVLIGMNFDNDGKDFKISSGAGHDFLVSVRINNTFYPSFGITRSGVFFNDLMVDSDGSGKYKRQTGKRWVTTSLIKYILETGASFEDLKILLPQIEIVNAPNISTHSLIADRTGGVCIVEPGRGHTFSAPQDSDWVILTNFHLADGVTGSGSDRYLQTHHSLSALNAPLTVSSAFEILKSVKQTGPIWRTALSLVYDSASQELFYCLDQDFDRRIKYDFPSP